MRDADLDHHEHGPARGLAGPRLPVTKHCSGTSERVRLGSSLAMACSARHCWVTAALDGGA
jgi:hypothetical protein